MKETKDEGKHQHSSCENRIPALCCLCFPHYPCSNKSDFPLQDEIQENTTSMEEKLFDLYYIFGIEVVEGGIFIGKRL